MTFDSSSRFGSYEVIGQIGAGGMGEVYQATDTTLGRQVALKVLPESFAADPNRVARFEREARTLASLNHTNIAQVYGVEKSDDTTAIVMELVEGPTLAQRIAEGPLPPEEALAIAWQIIAALAAAHEQQIVHRDLKPANIKLRPDGTVKVLDFGIAKVLEAPESAGGPKAPSLTTPVMTQAGILLGTAAYMSPEQARGKPVDRRADIWAFGCVLYEMLTGQPAFGGEDVHTTLARVLERGANLDSLGGTISPAVNRTIALCLEKDPRQRIADIVDVRLALEGRFESTPARISETRAANPLWRRLLPLAVVAVVVATASIMITARVFESPATQSPLSRNYMVLPADLFLTRPWAPSLALSPDGNMLAISAADGLYLQRLGELEAQLIAGTEGEKPEIPVFSPDGRWIAYGSTTERALKRVRVDGGTPERVLNEFPTSGWSWPSMEVIYFASACTISRVSPTGGDSTVIANHEGEICSEPGLLPDSNQLIYQRNRLGSDDPLEIVVETPDTGVRTVLFAGARPRYVEQGYLAYYDDGGRFAVRTFDPATLAYGDAVSLQDDVATPVRGGNIQFAISDSGTLAYIPGTTGTVNDIVAITEEDGQLEALDIPAGDYAHPAVSPDDRLLALQVGTNPGNRNIFVYDLVGGGDLRPLTNGGDNMQPTWSSDGVWVTYASNRDGRLRIYRQRGDGTGPAQPLTDPPMDSADSFPVWAPDGRLSYTRSASSGSDIWIQAIPDGAPEVLISGSGNLGANAFSPGGDAMAYHTDESGLFAVMAVPFPSDGSAPRRISEAGVLSGWPVWSRDGTQIYHQDANWAFDIVDITMPGLTASNRRTLTNRTAESNRRRQDSMHTSDRVVLAVPAAPGNGITMIVVVENWIRNLP